MMLENVWVDLILFAMVSLIITQNMGLRERLKRIEEKLDRLER
jgi:hypothetical protein